MDINLPGKSGIECIACIKERCSGTQFIMFTIFEDDEKVFDALEAGAHGYLLKKTLPAKILEGIVDVSEGGAPMSPVIARKVLQLYPKKSANYNNELDKLTTREMEVLQLLARGYSYKMVAAELIISIDTVRTFIKHIYGKLHVHSLGEAIAKAFLDK